MVQKVAYILASVCEGEWFSHLFSVLRKMGCKLEKNGQNSEKVFHYFICAKKSRPKKFDVILNLKRSLHKPRKSNETMNPIFGLGHEI